METEKRNRRLKSSDKVLGIGKKRKTEKTKPYFL